MIIRSEEIYKKANSIVRSCGTRDTLKIARELGIYVHYIDTLNDLLGMYTYRHKERHILLNSGMEHMVVQLSAMMGTNINLMLIKLNEMNRMGWGLNLPYVPHADFLKQIKPEG